MEVHPFLQCRRLVDLAKSEGIQVIRVGAQACTIVALTVENGLCRVCQLLSQVTAFSPLGNGKSYHMIGYQVIRRKRAPIVMMPQEPTFRDFEHLCQYT